MSLVGTYKCEELGATLVVAKAQDSNGRGEGTFTFGGKSIGVSFHYHFKNSNQPPTALNLVGNKDDPNYYVGAAGNTTFPDYKKIELAGGFSTNNVATSFGGVFRRA